MTDAKYVCAPNEANPIFHWATCYNQWGCQPVVIQTADGIDAQMCDDGSGVLQNGTTLAGVCSIDVDTNNGFRGRCTSLNRGSESDISDIQREFCGIFYEPDTCLDTMNHETGENQCEWLQFCVPLGHRCQTSEELCNANPVCMFVRDATDADQNHGVCRIDVFGRAFIAHKVYTALIFTALSVVMVLLVLLLAYFNEGIKDKIGVERCESIQNHYYRAEQYALTISSAWLLTTSIVVSLADASNYRFSDGVEVADTDQQEWVYWTITVLGCLVLDGLINGVAFETEAPNRRHALTHYSTEGESDDPKDPLIPHKTLYRLYIAPLRHTIHLGIVMGLKSPGMFFLYSETLPYLLMTVLLFFTIGQDLKNNNTLTHRIIVGVLCVSTGLWCVAIAYIVHTADVTRNISANCNAFIGGSAFVWGIQRFFIILGPMLPTEEDINRYQNWAIIEQLKMCEDRAKREAALLPASYSHTPYDTRELFSTECDSYASDETMTYYEYQTEPRLFRRVIGRVFFHYAWIFVICLSMCAAVLYTEKYTTFKWADNQRAR